VSWLDPANEAAAEADILRAAFFLELDFVSGFVRLNDAGHVIVWGGNIWYGIGELGSFEAAEESTEFVARGERYQLNGVNPDLIATITSERYQGRRVTRYLGFFDASGALVADPQLMWTGFMDTLEVETGATENGGSGSVLVLTAEHRLRSQPPFARWSDACQKAKTSPPDRFFDNAHFVDSYVSQWGDKQTTYGTKPGGGYGPG
jgi:hypothetical protein